MEKHNIKLLISGFIFGTITVLPAFADVKLPAIFSDNMVFQQGRPLPVWGWADKGEQVTVSFTGQEKSAITGDNGKWMLKLDPMKASSKLSEMKVSGKNTLVITNVLVGEVWVGSGQSNMEVVPDGRAKGTREFEKNADCPEIRIFTVQHRAIRYEHGALLPESDCTGKWVVCSPKTFSGISAVGYHFAREIHSSLKVPVGMLMCAVGGTPAQNYTDRETLESDPILKIFTDETDVVLIKMVREPSDKIPESLRKWAAFSAKDYGPYPLAAKASPELRTWVDQADNALAEGKRVPPLSPEIAKAFDFMKLGLATTRYNSMVSPLISYAITGVIWYQGEANGGGIYLPRYGRLFSGMIRAWRRAWGQGDFPFYYVQLANYSSRTSDPNAISWWAMLRDMQLRVLGVPNTGMAVAIDIGEAKNIHPRNKLDVGRRLALIALANTYGRKGVVYSGPIYAGMKIENGKIRLNFKHLGGGLMAKGEADKLKGLATDDEDLLADVTIDSDFSGSLAAKDDKLKGFALCGEDHKYVWADAAIDGETVVLSSTNVPNPVAARYAWANNPACNLYNKAGLPASPFCTETSLVPYDTVIPIPELEKKNN